MFLADSMRLVASGLADSHPMMQSRSFLYHRMRCKEILEDYSLFAFTRSALEVAADLRMDTPERLENVAGAVFAKPRKVFIEAGYADRMSVLSRLRGFPRTELPEGRHEPVRVGLSIDCKGEGRADISSFWIFSSGQVSARERKQAEAMCRTRLERDAVGEISRIGTTMCSIKVDLAQASTKSLNSFTEAVGRKDDWAVRHMALIEAMMQRGGRIDGKSRHEIDTRTFVREAWRSYRMNELSRLGIDRRASDMVLETSQMLGKSPEAIVGDAESDLDGELIYALAMLAALEAQGDVLVRQDRPAQESRAAKADRKPVSRQDIETDHLAVLSLKIGDRDLVRGPSGGRGDEELDEGISRQGHPRVRHPVQGHLFLARNGKMLYRRPHWRGGRIARTITRVR